jgi:hypothetical protein
MTITHVDSSRTRLSKDSIATIKKAETAKVEKDQEGQFEVKVFKGDAVHFLQAGDGKAKYDTVTAAKQAVRRHNQKVRFPQEPGIPAPGFE